MPSACIFIHCLISNCDPARRTLCRDVRLYGLVGTCYESSLRTHDLRPEDPHEAIWQLHRFQSGKPNVHREHGRALIRRIARYPISFNRPERALISELLPLQSQCSTSFLPRPLLTSMPTDCPGSSCLQFFVTHSSLVPKYEIHCSGFRWLKRRQRL